MVKKYKQPGQLFSDAFREHERETSGEIPDEETYQKMGADDEKEIKEEPVGSIGIHFGALCKPISEQLESQGYILSENDAKRIEGISRAIIMLNIHGYLPDSIRRRCNQKLLKDICKSVVVSDKVRGE